MEIAHSMGYDTFQVQHQLDEKSDICEQVILSDEAVHQLVLGEISPHEVNATVPNDEVGLLKLAINLTEEFLNKEEIIKQSKMQNTDSILVEEIQNEYKDPYSLKMVDVTALISKSEEESSKETKNDPKLRSNSFYGRRDTLLKAVKKFRNDFPECDALVFGNWRLQDNSNKPWPKDLSDFGQRQIETIINYLDPRYKFPCDERLWERYKDDTTDTRRAKLSKKRKMFDRKVGQLAALGNNDIFFIFMYPTKEYKDINSICHSYIDTKPVQRPYYLILEFLRRLMEEKNPNQMEKSILALPQPIGYHIKSKQGNLQKQHNDGIEDDQLNELELVASGNTLTNALIMEGNAFHRSLQLPPISSVTMFDGHLHSTLHEAALHSMVSSITDTETSTVQEITPIHGINLSMEREEISGQTDKHQKRKKLKKG